MAAFDSFEQFNSLLSPRDRELLGDLIEIRRAEMLAARSEDARVRLVRGYIEEVGELLREERR